MGRNLGKEIMNNKEEIEIVEAKKFELDVMEEEGILQDIDEQWRS